jgi:hypothetical protein
MTIIEASKPINLITFKNILYLTDFSQASRAALPFARELLAITERWFTPSTYWDQIATTVQVPS